MEQIETPDLSKEDYFRQSICRTTLATALKKIKSDNQVEKSMSDEQTISFSYSDQSDVGSSPPTYLISSSGNTLFVLKLYC